jgi:light-regulated signal transduction histidine kinase (bacteriophytochrome)
MTRGLQASDTGGDTRDGASSQQQERLLANATQRADDLQRLLDERTAELERRSEDMRALSYTLSHDLRAPIRAMSGFGQALLEDYGDQLDDVARDFINRIVEAAGDLDRQIQAILARSCADEGAPAATQAGQVTK